jgi:hypothetical protein
MEAGTDAAEPAQRVTRRSFGKKRSARYRKNRHHRRHYAAAKPKRAPAAEIDPAESLRTGAKLKTLKQTLAQTPENVGIGIDAWRGIDANPTAPRLASPLPPPSPMPALKSTSDLGPTRGVKADMITVQPALVKTTSFVPSQPVGQTMPAQSALEQPVLQMPAAQTDLTVMRAMLLTFAGLLAVGTAVRMVV